MPGSLAAASHAALTATPGCSSSTAACLFCTPHPPCSNKVVWSFNRCEFTDFYGWADAVDEVLRAQGLVLEKYAHRCGA